MRSEGYIVVVCVCLSVHGYSGTIGHGAVYGLYKRLQTIKILKNETAIFQKRLHSEDNKQINQYMLLTMFI